MCFAAPAGDCEALDGDSPYPGASYVAQVSMDREAGSPGPPEISRPLARWSRGLWASSPASPSRPSRL